jgi:hypothetical protein
LQSPSRSAAAMVVVTRERIGSNVGRTTWKCRGRSDHTPRVPLTLLSTSERAIRSIESRTVETLAVCNIIDVIAVPKHMLEHAICLMKCLETFTSLPDTAYFVLCLTQF